MMTTLRNKRRALTALFAFGFLCTNIQPALWAAETASAVDVKNPQIASGDVVAIIVYPAEEYNREVTVQPDGKIELALIGSITVKGLTAKELSAVLESKYARYVDNPKVTVTTRHFSGRKVAIIGEVRTAGYYEYRDGMKLLELVSLAGGLGDNARTKKISVLRAGQTEAHNFNFQTVLDGNVDRDLALLPGDTIFVPKTAITKKAGWLTNNILPWLSFLSVVASLVIISRTQ
jgi:protein involved in polysaccharide export with SLBB domain